jgi:hypothetical protein
VDTLHNITALVNLAKAVPELPSDCIITMHQASVTLAPSKHRINSTTAGPSCHQVLIQLDPMPADSTFPAIVGSANRALSQVDLWVDSCFSAYGGIALRTNHIASQPEMDLIGLAVTRALLLETPVTAALPSS